MILRVLTALILAPLAILTILSAPHWVFLVVSAVVASACFFEFEQLARDHGAGFSPLFGVIAGLLVLLTPLEQGFLVTLVFVLAGLSISLRNENLATVLLDNAALALGLVYCFFTMRCGIALREIAPYWLLFALALNWLADTFAYAGGKAMGRHKLAPILSPGKTWEGAASSLAGSLLFGWLFLGYFAPHRGVTEALVLSALVNVAGQIGDLAESAIKRGAGRKDSGTLLPGHGGWLDRMDSSLFAMPVTLLWLLRFP